MKCSILNKHERRDMKDYQPFLTLLRCPQCSLGRLSIGKSSKELRCDACGVSYPVVDGHPVLLRNDNEIFCLDDYRRRMLATMGKTEPSMARFVPKPSVNLARKQVLERMIKILSRLESPTVLVVGSGSSRLWLDDLLRTGNINVIYSDIDVGADVDIFCDGHDLPFADDVFDAVVTTAVLEHVLYPERVAIQIHRVLKIGGLLYSEMPFMQQVHEGAYDFTRYSLSGHCRLFNGFFRLESGMVAGPATALLWAIENFFLAFARRSFIRASIKAVIRIAFSWLKHFDRLLVNRPEAMDGASCTYFLGRKIEGRVTDAEIIAGYVGAKHMRHT